MPELPDVETYKRYLDSTSLHAKIDKLEFPEKMEIFRASANDFRKALEGHKLTRSQRVGKYLFVESSSGKWLVLHFGMTGYLEYYKNQEMPAYTKLLVDFSNGYHLAVINKRKLGSVDLADDVEEYCRQKDLGKDALEFSRKEFEELLKNKGGSIKGALMDQNSIAGIGNVYSDEILYHSGIHPKSDAKKLSVEELHKLYSKMMHILELVIDKGAEPSELPGSWLIGHRKDGADCPKCKGKIRQIKISGRSTYFCPGCQEE